MIATFLFLVSRSLKNRALKRLRRLREPRYALGLVAGLLYLYWFFVRNQFRAARGAGGAQALASMAGPGVTTAIGAVLWAIAVLAWLWPASDAAFKFSGAEIQFLYTAPVSRRVLVQYKLLRGQLGVLSGVLVASAFSGAAAAAATGRWMFLLGGWLLFATGSLHVRGIRLARASMRAGLRHLPWRTWVPLALMAGCTATFAFDLAARWSRLQGLFTDGHAREALRAAATGPLGYALWPFSAVAAPAVAPGPMEFAKSVLPALAILALNYWWVLESAAGLETSIVAVEKKDATDAKRRAKAPVVRRPPFTLRPDGRPEIALLWKNLVLLGRYASVRLVIRVMLPAVVLATILGLSSGAGEWWTMVAAMFAGFATLIGPYMVRNDLRHDLPRLSILKTWPIPGWSIVAGELLAPAAALSVAAWFLIAVAGAFSFGLPAGTLGNIGRLVLVLGAALVAPLLIVAQLLVQNAAVVLFPGWVSTGESRPRGIEAMGQNIVMFAGTLLALVVGVLPPAVAAGAIGFLLYWPFGWPGLIPAVALFALLLAAEAGFAVLGLGRMLDRTEPSQVEAAE